MEIYADVILLINFVMNSFILWAVAKISRQRVQYLWLFAGGLVMALMYVITMMVVPFSFVMSAASSVIMLSLGIAVAFRPRGVRVFLGMVLVGFLCSFTIGGLGMMLVYRLPTVSLGLLAVCILGAYVLIKFVIRMVDNITIKKQMLCPVTIYIGEEELSLRALVDTGHTLHDPLNNAPVIIAEFDSVKEILPDGVRLMFYERQEDDLTGVLSAMEGSRFYERVRMIPFVSLGVASGMLIGFRADRVELEAEFSAGQREIRDVVIGIYNRKLCGDGRYQGLIGAELVA